MGEIGVVEQGVDESVEGIPALFGPFKRGVLLRQLCEWPRYVGEVGDEWTLVS